MRSWCSGPHQCTDAHKVKEIRQEDNQGSGGQGQGEGTPAVLDLMAEGGGYDPSVEGESHRGSVFISAQAKDSPNRFPMSIFPSMLLFPQ